MTNGEGETDFDCLEFKRRAQERIYEEIKDLTPEQEIEYWRRSVDEGPFGSWWRTLEKEPQVVREKAKGSGDDVESE
jgi:hypothetical protein